MNIKLATIQKKVPAVKKNFFVHARGGVPHAELDFFGWRRGQTLKADILAVIYGAARAGYGIFAVGPYGHTRALRRAYDRTGTGAGVQWEECGDIAKLAGRLQTKAGHWWFAVDTGLLTAWNSSCPSVMRKRTVMTFTVTG